MLRWSSSLRLSLRCLTTRVGASDPLLDKLRKSTNKYHIFQLVGVHRPKLTLEHATCALNVLLRCHKRNSKTLESISHIQEHPEFVALCAVVENNIDSMEDRQIVNILNIIDGFQVDAHSPLMRRLFTEGWRRLQRLDPKSLSTFAAYLGRQGMTTSPLMGQIANIVDGCLDNIEDPVTITGFTSSLYAVSSPRLWDRLIQKTESSLDKLSPSHFHNLIELIEVIGKKRLDKPFVKKCDKLLYNNAGAVDLQTTYRIMRMYADIHLFNCEFNIEAKSKLIGEVNRCDQPDVFANLFIALYPNVSNKMKEGFEKKLLNMADAMTVKDLYDVLKIMEYAKCKNPELIQKICSVLREDFSACSSEMLCDIVQALVFLDLKNYNICTELQTLLRRRLFSSFIPTEVAELLRALFLLRSVLLNDDLISKLHNIIGQSNLHGLSLMSSVVPKLLPSNTLHSKRLTNLNDELYSYRLERLNGAKCLDSLLYELKDEDFITMNMKLRKTTLKACKRLMHQVNRNNVAQLSGMVLQINMDCSPLLERIAAVTLDNINKFSPSAIYPILSVFSYLNLKPSQGDDFFNACAQLISNKIDSLSPYYLVLTVYSLVIAGYFPKELVNAIFNPKFLLHFDDQLDAFVYTMGVRLRNYLMQLNRAICIEHPEYGVPWFHEQFCQEMLRKEEHNTNVQLQMLLEPIFGGRNYTKMTVQTPYRYTIAFEYILDKNKNLIPYVDGNALTPDSSSVLKPGSQIEEDKPLPEGAQRVAVDFLQPKAFLQYSNHIKGLSTMKKKHLEILGYQVVQIPNFEMKDFASLPNMLPGNIASGNVS